MTTWAVVPVKPLAQAKSRLAARLDAGTRRALVLAMLDRVLAALRATPDLDGRLVVTADARVAGFARDRGAEVLHEQPVCGLNAALLRAACRLQAQGVQRMLVVPADVPYVRAADFRRLLGCADPHTRVVVRAKDGRGTGALLAPLPFVPCFGTDSFVQHCIAAPEQRVLMHDSPCIGFDIDDPADLDRAGLDAATLVELARG